MARAWLMGVAWLALSASARADDFFRGKTLTILVNLTAGGPTDTEARLLSRHIAKHIAGNPNVVVRNMNGAAGNVAANWLGQAAPNDGLTLGFFSTVAGASLMGAPSLKIELAKMTFAGTGSGVSVTYGRRDINGGLKTPDDFMQAKEVWMGGLAIDVDKDLRLRLQLDMLGMNYRYVTGYPGAADVRLAMQRNEVQMTSESMPSYRAAVEPAMVQKGEALPLWIDFASEMETPRPHEADGIEALSFVDYFRKMKGATPTGEKWDAFDAINTIARGYERVLLMAPNTPADALTAVKAGLAALKDDDDFRKDGMATMKFAPVYDTSDHARDVLIDKASPNPNLITFFNGYIEEGKTKSGVK